MKKLFVTLMLALLSGINVAWAQPQTPPAEVYMYGHVIGPVTVADIATDGQVITIKGVQYWPRLSASTSTEVLKQDPSKHALHERLWSLHEQMLNGNKSSVVEIRHAMAEMMRNDPLVLDVREPNDANNNCFEYRLKDDPNTDWIVVEGIGLRLDRPTYAQRLETELTVLRRRVESGWTIIISPEGGFFVPPNARDNQKIRIQEEIQAAINGQWSGNLLSQKEAELFRNPLDLVAATARFQKLHNQED
jgi:hypothetical protein